MTGTVKEPAVSSRLDRLEPEFVPAALAFGSGNHGVAAFLFRGRADGTAPSLADVPRFRGPVALTTADTSKSWAPAEL